MNVERTIYDEADDVVVRDPIPKDPYLDAKERGECEYVLKFLGAFSKGPGNGKPGFFKLRWQVVSGTGEDPYAPGTDVTHFIKPRDFNAHVKDIKKAIAALTGTKPSTVTKENIDEAAADNPDNGGSGELNGVEVTARLVKNERGFLNIEYSPRTQRAN